MGPSNVLDPRSFQLTCQQISTATQATYRGNLLLDKSIIQITFRPFLEEYLLHTRLRERLILLLGVFVCVFSLNEGHVEARSSFSHHVRNLLPATQIIRVEVFIDELSSDDKSNDHLSGSIYFLNEVFVLSGCKAFPEEQYISVSCSGPNVVRRLQTHLLGGAASGHRIGMLLHT